MDESQFPENSLTLKTNSFQQTLTEASGPHDPLEEGVGSSNEALAGYAISFTLRNQFWRKMSQEPQVQKVERGDFINTCNSSKMSPKSLGHHRQS